MKRYWKTGIVFLGLTVATFLFFQNCAQQISPNSKFNSDEDGKISLDRGITSSSLSSVANTFEGYDVIVIAGQSNAVGAGKWVDGQMWQDELKNKRPELDQRIFQIGRYEDDLKLVPATDTLQHFGFRDNKNNVGFGMAFARRYVAGLSSNRNVILVPAAMGGTSIHEWTGEHPVIDKSTGQDVVLLKSLSQRLSRALKQVGPNRDVMQNRFVAILWQHGEADIRKMATGEDGMTPELYIRKMNRVFDAIKSVQPGSDPSILIGEPVPAWTVAEGGKNYDVTKQKQAFKTALLENTETLRRSYVRSQTQYPPMRLTSNREVGAGDDNVHYNAQSQINLGQLYYNAYLNTVYGALAGLRITNSEASNALSFIVKSIDLSTTAVPTNKLDVGVPGLHVVLGIDSRGGGYVNYMEILDKGINRVAPKFGRGMQTAIRDRLHSLKYNPTQAGYMDSVGAPVKVVEMKNERGQVKALRIPQFNIPLWNGDGEYDYVQAPKSVIDQPPHYLDNDDIDFLDEAGKTGDGEVRSEFDYAGKFERATEEFGIPAIHHSFYFAYNRKPSAILQFTNPLAMTKPQEKDKEPVPVLNPLKYIHDVSEADGLQTAHSTDMSDVIFRTFSGRIVWDKDLFNNFYYYIQVNGKWVGGRMPLDPLTGNRIDSEPNPPYMELLNNTTKFNYLRDGNIVPVQTEAPKNTAKLSQELLIISNVCNAEWIGKACPSAAPKRPMSIAYFYPLNARENKYPVVVMNRSDLSIHREESRIIEVGFNMVGFRDLDDLSFVAPKMELRLSGILSPLRYREDFKQDRFEAVRQKIFVLFARQPAEVIKAVEKYKSANNL